MVGRLTPSRLLAAFALCAAAMVLVHAPWLSLSWWWDEVGQFVPQSLDLLEQGRLIPRTAAPNVHPPAVPALIAAVWRATGVSIVAGRVTMLVLAGLLAAATWTLGHALGVARPWRAVVVMAAVPVVYMQSMMVQLDMPAAALSSIALVLFLRGRMGWCAAACALLVLIKETGAVAPLLFAAVMLREGRRREAAWFVLSVAPLAIWLAYLRMETGHLFGDPSFARYNTVYSLHPVRIAVAVLRRVYALVAANGMWIGALPLGWALMRRRHEAFGTRSWRIAGALAGLYVAVFCLLGGAALERYLLPVYPVVVLAMVEAIGMWTPRWQNAVIGLLAAVCAASLWIRPPYPYPLENNLAMTGMVALHREAAAIVDASVAAGPCVATAWPFSDALRRPEYGYVRRTGYRVVVMDDYSAAAVDRPEVAACGLIVVYPRVTAAPLPGTLRLLERYYGYRDQLTPAEMAARLGRRPLTRFERGGLWVEILAP
jgi:hypothetical protein